MGKAVQAKYIAPTVHILLFAVTWILYVVFDQPLANGPSALPFFILMIADLPLSILAFGFMFSGGTGGAVAVVLWGVGGSFWWYLLGCAIDALIRRICGTPSREGTETLPDSLAPVAVQQHFILGHYKSWVVAGVVVGAITIVALMYSWNGPTGDFQEGTIGNFAISPDGRSVLLSRTVKNHTALYRVSLDTGAALRLTDGSAREEYLPTFSPDGKQIAFVRRQEDGGAARIFLMNSDGSNLHPLFPSAFNNDSAPQFAADGTHIMFARTVEEVTPDPPQPVPWDVFISRLDGDSATPLTTHHYSAESRPVFSSDGRRFLYSTGGLSRESLYVVKLDRPDKSPEPLLFRVPNGPYSPIYDSPRLAPDGRSAIFLAATQGAKAFDYDVFRFDLATHTLTKLTKSNGYASDLAISPDGNWAVFLRWTSRWGSLPTLSRLYLMNTSTGELAPLPITGKR